MTEENSTVDRLRGRADFLRLRGRIKDAELMEEAAAALDAARIGEALRHAELHRGVRLLLSARSPKMCYRNAAERQAYEILHAIFGD